MARNGVDVGLHRPSYTSPLSEYVLQAELPARWKVPKFTKFSGDTSESIVEHVARYLIEAGEIANNENLRIQYFPSSLTKNAFTWFTILPANSIDTWTRLEILFHEQLYMEQSKISLKELASIKRQFTESIDELVEMTAGGLLKAEKSRANKNNRKDRIAYVELGNDEPETFGEHVDFDEGEIDLAELTQGPPYSCKVLTPSNGKNPVERDKDARFPKKTDVMKSAIRDRRLKFGDKSKAPMRIDADPL
ncbi:uncharacterized protein LOC127094646 [Lathyrus oleraceus]|uniref:uncharacterized protein LOC127094646 n=1 Tax=Pisum sativum TaxID=3888 RepID=UPI0021D0EB20|nr:uncharacterized protein LOC127094646 [Pisum sativum]